MSLTSLFNNIQPLNEAAMTAAKARQAVLTKPAGSLGRLEELSIQVAGITGQPLPDVTRKVVTMMAGYHGVVAEGVSAFPSNVTPQMATFGEAGVSGKEDGSRD